ncbi:hypothetical protein T492DRAFT_854762 [Pavlovales sp. CCMP2436]|nr:hypothetical protein T492DRAFT_854762 [Pavlovales sp. CCMP2436]
MASRSSDGGRGAGDAKCAAGGKYGLAAEPTSKRTEVYFHLHFFGDADLIRRELIDTLSGSMSLHTMVQQKAQRRDTLAATEFVLCETVYACGVAPCEIATAKRCPTCRTIAESGRACGKVSYALQRVGPWQRSALTTAAPAAE